MANDLQTITGSNTKTPCSVLRSELPALASLIDDVNPYAQRMITPAEREKLAALVPQYEAALKPAPPQFIEKSLGALAAAFPASRVSDEEASVRLRMYTQALGDMPADLLANACREAVKSCTFFPVPAELRKFAKDLYSRQFRLSRIKHLIAKHDREYRAPDPVDDAPMTDEQREWLKSYYARNGMAA